MFGRNREEKKLQNTEEVSCPIRAVIGIGNNMVHGLGLLYQRSSGSAGFQDVWVDDHLFNLIRFVEEGESRIVWTRSFWSDGTHDEVISQIYIR